jgi:hypothetical protein
MKQPLHMGIDFGNKNNGIVISRNQPPYEIVYNKTCSLEECLTIMPTIFEKHKGSLSGVCIEQPIVYNRGVPPQVIITLSYYFGEVLGIVKSFWSVIIDREILLITQPKSIINNRLGLSGKTEIRIRNNLMLAYGTDNNPSLNEHEKDAFACSLFLNFAYNNLINPVGNILK